jgi:hypothetical protein
MYSSIFIITIVVVGIIRLWQQTLLTQYEEEEFLMQQEVNKEEWEFKILRSLTHAFGEPEVFRKVLEEEEKSGGWILIEKLDNGRLRFKRKKKSYHYIDVEAYRTYYGLSPQQYQWRNFLLIFSALLVGMLLYFCFVRLIF